MIKLKRYKRNYTVWIKSGCLFLFFITSFHFGFSQSPRKIDSLAVLSDQIRIAKLTGNNPLILKTYFNNYFASIASVWSTTKDDLDRAARFIQEGIDFAVSIHEYDYAAVGYTQKAAILRKKGDKEKALEAAKMALGYFEKIESDSVKVVVYTELGDCYQEKSEAVEASKQYNNAFDIAVKGEDPALESGINFRLAILYFKQGDTIEAKKQLYKNVLLNKKNKNGEGLIADYTQLARVTDNTFYIDTVFSIADSLHLKNKTFSAKGVLFAIYGFVKKDTKRALDYLNSEPELKESYMKGGIANYHFLLAQLYLTNNIPDSALHYLKLAEPAMLKEASISKLERIYLHQAKCYEMLNDTKNAIDYYEKTLEYSRKLGNLPTILSVSNSLSLLYGLTGNFKNAYSYKLLASNTKDSIVKLSKDRDMVLLDIYRETKKHEEELLQKEEYLHKKHNLQYLGITIGICILLLCFLVLGMFPVSKLLIKIFGFIYFICVFEFIVLLIEHSVLHPITHGDPLKLWSLKIILIALLVPVQQYLEHGLIHFLQSRKLHQARTKFLAEKWKKKKPVPQPASDPEIEPGVL